MVSQTLTTKQILSLLEGNRNLCEISSEYPSLKQPLPPRHLCTCTKSSIVPQKTIIQKLSDQTTTEHHGRNSNSSSRVSHEQIESIESFQDDEINKLYKKSRYQLTKRNDESIIDNTN
ncbi:unnamed protein product [Adineta steineri]|uniref:Uncharacterized protein n=1 Tax=Adineta steineri TaxID=433720 RepID=A0A815ZV74_9BILA|nr:unnamed protein product [Adineta steineri]CAF1329808.1 unnamed protein product [Adineta steineri]CAF1588997.1 unnamed protein product [Adineta steineri]CAF1589076.1 unnamed protein product [Adineta steineri]